MFTNIPFLRASDLLPYRVEIRQETSLVHGFGCIHKPERATCRSKMLDDFRSDSHLNSLNSLEKQSLQILVEIVASQHFFKMTIGLEYVSMVVCFQMIPVVSQSKITDSIKSLFCLIGVSNNQTSALQCQNLLCHIACLVYLMSIYKKCPAGYAVLMGSGRDLSVQR